MGWTEPEVRPSRYLRQQPQQQQGNAFTRRRERMRRAAETIQRAWAVYHAKCVLENKLKKQMAVIRQRDRLVRAVEIVRRAWLGYREKRFLEFKRRKLENAASRIIVRAMGIFYVKCVLKRKIAVRAKQHREDNASSVIVRFMARCRTKLVAEKNAISCRQVRAVVVIQRGWAVYRFKCILEIKRQEEMDSASRIISHWFTLHRTKPTSRKHMDGKVQLYGQVDGETLLSSFSLSSLETTTTKLNAVISPKNRLNSAANSIRSAWLVFCSKRMVGKMHQGDSRQLSNLPIGLAYPNSAQQGHDCHPFCSRQERMHEAARALQRAWSKYHKYCELENIHNKKKDSLKHDCLIDAVGVIRRAWLAYGAKCELKPKEQERVGSHEFYRELSATQVSQRSRESYRLEECEGNGRKQNPALVISASLLNENCVLERKLARAAETIQRAWLEYGAKDVDEQKSGERKTTTVATKNYQTLSRRHEKMVSEQQERLKEASAVIWRALTRLRFLCELNKKVVVRKENKVRSTAALIIQRAYRKRVVEPAAALDKSVARFPVLAVAFVVIMGTMAATVTLVNFNELKSYVQTTSWAGTHYHADAALGNGKDHASLWHFERRYVDDQKNDKPVFKTSVPVPVSQSSLSMATMEKDGDMSALIAFNEDNAVDENHLASVVVQETVTFFSPMLDSQFPLLSSAKDHESSRQLDAGNANRFLSPSVAFFDRTTFLPFTVDGETSLANEKGHDGTWAGIHHRGKTVFGHGKHRHAALAHFEHRYVNEHQSEEGALDKSGSLHTHSSSTSETKPSPGTPVSKVVSDQSLLLSEVTEWNWLAKRVKQKENA